LNVTALRGGKPVPDAVVAVRDKQVKEVFTGQTDAKGEIRDIAVITTRYRQETKDPRRITMDRQEFFSVCLSSEGATVSREIAVRANTSVSLDLASAGR
jgi:hypothetical protein